MTAINTVTVSGNITHELEKKTYNGRSFVSFQIASTQEWKKQDGTEGESTSFLPVTAWGSLADQVCDEHRKGSPIMVSGSFRSSSWEDNGKRRNRVFIAAKEIYNIQKQAEEKEEPAAPEPDHEPGEIRPEDIPF